MRDCTNLSTKHLALNFGLREVAIVIQSSFTDSHHQTMLNALCCSFNQVPQHGKKENEINGMKTISRRFSTRCHTIRDEQILANQILQDLTQTSQIAVRLLHQHALGFMRMDAYRRGQNTCV
jgi:hypothetical protein